MKKVRSLNQEDKNIYGYIEVMQRAKNGAVTQKEIAAVFKKDTRSIRASVEVLRAYYQSRDSDNNRNVKRFVGWTRDGYMIGTTDEEDEKLKEETATRYQEQINDMQEKVDVIRKGNFPSMGWEAMIMMVEDYARYVVEATDEVEFDSALEDLNELVRRFSRRREII